MKPLPQALLRLVMITLVACAAAIVTSAQTSADLRTKYVLPQMSQLDHGRPVIERYLVGPNILLTIKYTKQGEPCEAILEPVPSTMPNDASSEHPAGRDIMSTAEVIKVINELLPIEKRGKKVNELSSNGGDRDMKLHHPGCAGAYYVFFEHAIVACSTWCWGGTFSATIHWGKTICRGQRIKPNSRLNRAMF
jgi:hypothetical protein